MNYLTTICTCLGWLCGLPMVLGAAEWISDPSYYTHSPETGGRVTQFAPVGPFFIHPRPDYMESGFRHERSSLRVGDSADNYVRTSQWGNPVRPYGEWQFPYRPYSVPYDLWGPQFGFGAFGPGPFGFPGGAGFGPGFGPGSGVGPGAKLPYAQPFTDDTWYDRRTRPQGFRGSVDHVFGHKHFKHKSHGPKGDYKKMSGEHAKGVGHEKHERGADEMIYRRPDPHTHYAPFGVHGH